VEHPKSRKPYFRVSPVRQRRSRWRALLLLVLLAGVVAGAGLLALRYEQLEGMLIASAPTATPSPSPTLSPTSAPTRAPTAISSPLPLQVTLPATHEGVDEGTLIFSAYAGGYSRLFFYHPGEPKAAMLSRGTWDERDPAVSPDGRWLAFSSRRNGWWDLYLMDLVSGELRQLTATQGYEGHPAWSPDGQWIAFEAYYEGNYDLWILPLDGSGGPLRLTDSPAADVSPHWSPQGRHVVFSSNRTGDFDLYQFDLDAPQDGFENLTNSPGRHEHNPRYSPDGERLLFSAQGEGPPRLMVLDLRSGHPPLELGFGHQGVWHPSGGVVAAVQPSGSDCYLVQFVLQEGIFPSIGLAVSGNRVAGLDWAPGDYRMAAVGSVGGGSEGVEAPYQVELEAGLDPHGRMALVALPGVSAPIPKLSDAVDEAFMALREAMVRKVGWDFLANLDYAFVGINDPLPPGYRYNDWLYTGRAFAFSEAFMRAGWVEVVREELAGETYWRVYVRTRNQDGSLGEPLRAYPWDFSARFNQDPVAYDQGGQLKDSIPAGYYVDFTALAASYGFQRLPALPNWRTYYPGARFNEFALIEGLNWVDAMLQIYPPSALVTPTPFKTPTPTPTVTPSPTPTPWWLRWRTPTPTPTPTSTPTSTATP
jgi:TolB protein